MKPRLLPFLHCLTCPNSLDLRKAVLDGPEEVMEGELVCPGCQRTYPIRKGVPRMLPQTLEAIKEHTAERFGREWLIFDNLGERFERDLLQEFIHPLTPDIFKDAVVLEGGCGAGRNIRRAAEYGAREVIGVDISESVEVAFRKTRDLPNVHVIQCDLYAIPVVQSFDVVFSAGVLHHLPDPRKGFESLLQHARAGANVVHTVYSRENNEWLEKFVTPLRVRLTRYLPVPLLYGLSFLLAVPAYIVLKCVHQPINEIAFLKPLSSRLFYNDFGYLLARLGFRSTFAQIYDQLTAPIAFFISQDEIKTWMTHGGLGGVRYFWRNKNSWNFAGIKE